jgi:hypothetical protein
VPNKVAEMLELYPDEAANIQKALENSDGIKSPRRKG